MTIVKRVKKYLFIKRFGVIKYFRSLGVEIGNGCEISPNVNFGNEPYLIKLGNNVRVTNGVQFVTHDGGMWTLRKMGLLENADYFDMIKIGDNTHIGWNTIVMPGVTIGRNCIVGCGAVVTKDIEDNSVAVGVPARVIKSTDEYYDKYKGICDFTKGLNKEEKKKYLIKKFKLNN